MSARYCQPCDTYWPSSYQYRTTFGAMAAAPSNEICPACGIVTQYAHNYTPTPEDERATLLDIVAARRRYAEAEAAFESYYAEQAARELLEELEAWPTHAPA